VNGLYSSTKYSIEAISDALRLELASFGIKVILIEPGSIKTNFHENVNLQTGNITGSAGSVYHDLYENFGRFLEVSRRGAPGPGAVSAVIQKAIEDPRPRARYRANVPFFMKILFSIGDSPRDFLFKAALKIRTPARVSS
jgi:short-subunit dehydrogenase